MEVFCILITVFTIHHDMLDTEIIYKQQHSLSLIISSVRGVLFVLYLSFSHSTVPRGGTQEMSLRV